MCITRRDHDAAYISACFQGSKRKPKVAEALLQPQIAELPQQTPLTTQILEAIKLLPAIGSIHYKTKLLAEYIAPGKTQYVRFRGYWLRFVPSYGQPRGLSARTYAKVLAIMVQSPVIQRSDDMMPTCRIDTTDFSEWCTQINKFIDKLERHDEPKGINVEVSSFRSVVLWNDRVPA